MSKGCRHFGPFEDPLAVGRMAAAAWAPVAPSRRDHGRYPVHHGRRTPSLVSVPMALPLPTSLSPSKVSSFKDCALAFRLSAIDRLPEPPSPHAAKGTLVHRALELLMWEEDPPGAPRTRPWTSWPGPCRRSSTATSTPAWPCRADERAEFVADADQLIDNYFALEDPRQVQVLGTELRLSVEIGTLKLSGIIDRLELDADGELVVTDYKTGRAPSVAYEQSRLGGVHFYAFLCEQVLGRRPARVQLLHLREPLAISTVPSDQSIRGLRQQTLAVWAAVEQACAREDFRPRPGSALRPLRLPRLLPGRRRRPGPAASPDLAPGASRRPSRAPVPVGAAPT